MRKCLLIHTLAGQCIVNVGQRHDLSRDGDVVSLNTIRISLAVIPFMVPPADGISLLHQRFFLMEGQLLQHLRTDGCMSLHDLKLFFGQTSRFV